MMRNQDDLKEMRKQMFLEMEQKLRENQAEEDRLFYYHSSEDKIVLSHALFWTMTLPQFFKSKIRKEKFFLMLRQYEEEMLDAFLQDETKTSARFSTNRGVRYNKHSILI